MRALTLSFLASTLLISSFVFPSPAQARWKRISANSCQPSVIRSPTSAFGEYGFQTYVNGNIWFVCPFDDSDAFPKSAVNVLNVHGYANSGGVFVFACSRSWNNLSQGQCTERKTAPSGEFTISFSGNDLSSAWGPPYVTDFAWIEVWPIWNDPQTPGRVTVYGIYASD
jgi:hypothetical protein